MHTRRPLFVREPEQGVLRPPAARAALIQEKRRENGVFAREGAVLPAVERHLHSATVVRYAASSTEVPPRGPDPPANSDARAHEHTSRPHRLSKRTPRFRHDTSLDRARRRPRTTAASATWVVRDALCRSQYDACCDCGWRGHVTLGDGAAGAVDTARFDSACRRSPECWQATRHDSWAIRGRETRLPTLAQPR